MEVVFEINYKAQTKVFLVQKWIGNAAKNRLWLSHCHFIQNLGKQACQKYKYIVLLNISIMEYQAKKEVKWTKSLHKMRGQKYRMK